MREIAVIIPDGIDAAVVERAVERIVPELGLRVSLRGSLASFPGSLHWHLKQGRQSGTLEVTFAPRATCLWLSVHSGRDADWIDAMLRVLPGRLSVAIGQAQSAPN